MCWSTLWPARWQNARTGCPYIVEPLRQAYGWPRAGRDPGMRADGVRLRRVRRARQHVRQGPEGGRAGSGQRARERGRDRLRRRADPARLGRGRNLRPSLRDRSGFRPHGHRRGAQARQQGSRAHPGRTRAAARAAPSRRSPAPMPATARPATISWRAMSAAAARKAGCRARPAARTSARPGRSRASGPGRAPERRWPWAVSAHYCVLTQSTPHRAPI